MTDEKPTPESEEERVPPLFMRVRGGTDCHKLASCITESVRYHSSTEAFLTIEYVGAGACAQAIKAVIIANSMLPPHNKMISIVPRFLNKKHETIKNFVVTRFKLVISNLD